MNDMKVENSVLEKRNINNQVEERKPGWFYCPGQSWGIVGCPASLFRHNKLRDTLGGDLILDHSP
jgi:hypothetical protein